MSPAYDPRSPLVIGLVGGIGCGKSRIAALFAEAGAAVVSGDEAGHEALRQPALKDAIVARWGTDVLDANGEVNRRKLGGIVFAKAEELQALERLVHPWIKQHLWEQIVRHRQAGVRLIVVDAAILLEAGWDDLCAEIVFVDVPRPLRIERIVRGRGWTEKEVADREQAQLPVEEKARLAQHRLDNSGTLEQSRLQVAELLRRWGLTPEIPNPNSPQAVT